MFIIQAPYPTLQVTTILPSPQFSDAESLLDTVDIKRTMACLKNMKAKLTQ